MVIIKKTGIVLIVEILIILLELYVIDVRIRKKKKKIKSNYQIKLIKHSIE